MSETQSKSFGYYIEPRAKTYNGYKQMVIEKLEELTGLDGTSLFAKVYGVDETEIDGYPCAFVIERLGQGKILDTHRNEREWQFSVVIHQAVGSKTIEQSNVALLDAVDRVIATFDEDPTLEKNNVGRCKLVQVVPIELEYAQREQTVNRALLTVAIVDMVNRYK